MWDKRAVEKLDEAICYFSVSCKFRNVVDHYEWAFFGVYEPHVDNERMLMWDELSGVQHWWDVPWCVGGDFNVVRFPSEHLGAAGYTSSMFDFSDFISINGLVDIPMEGGSFTWFNNRDTVSMSRLDRFLFTTEWEGHYSRIGQRRLC